MRVGVISDTHDRLPTLRAALKRFRDLGLDTLFHPGDIVAPFAAKPLAEYPGTVHVVYGNNDGERAGLKQVLPQIQDGPLFVDLVGRRILVHHFIDWCSDQDLEQADVALTGHTHEVTIHTHHQKIQLNPGECCGWVTGKATVAVLDLASLDVEMIELPT